MNTSRHLTLCNALLGALLTLSAAASWAVPSFDAPEIRQHAPRPYQGPKCEDRSQQSQAGNANTIVPFDHHNSPCRLEDAHSEMEERVNEEHEKAADTLKKIDDWQGLNRRPQEEQHALQSPVPEPDSYAMLLGGLAVLALLARRRQRRA